MKVHFEYLTNTGRIRLRNEDALLVNDVVVSSISMTSPERGTADTTSGCKFLVADGLGGMPCGDLASRLVLMYFRDRFTTDPSELRSMVFGAKDELERFVSEENECHGMSTAVSGVFIREREALVFNVGDCRVYLKRDDSLELLTRDHTSAFELYEQGVISMTELREHPLRNFLTSTISGGIEETPKMHSVSIEIQKDDSILLCTDGLWDTISDSQISDILGLTPSEASNCLLSHALRDGRDNISFILVRVLS